MSGTHYSLKRVVNSHVWHSSKLPLIDTGDLRQQDCLHSTFARWFRAHREGRVLVCDGESQLALTAAKKRKWITGTINHRSSALILRVTALLSSRNHKTELATNADRSQSLKSKLTVEKARCKNGT